MKSLLLSFFLVFASVVTTVGAPDKSFEQWLKQFWPKARAAGITAQTYDQVMRGLTPDPWVVRQIKRQPEFATPIWDYIDTMVSQSRITNGQSALTKYQRLLNQIGRDYGVDPYAILAIWGIESSYGAALENKNLIKPVIRSIATLAHFKRGRVEQDEAELIAALKIIQRGEGTVESLAGSWGGAVGHTQLIPTAFLAHAVDYDGDGERDVWHSVPDSLASTAKYLQALGWNRAYDWGYEVELPKGFDLSLAGRDTLRPISFFTRRGVKRVSGRSFKDETPLVFLYMPAGLKGPKFLATQNYLVLKDYNFSDSYALSVAHLMDRLKGSKTFVKPWPRDTRPLTLEERKEVQQRLWLLGYYKDEIDGRIGPNTQKAVRAWQASKGLVADGFVTKQFLHNLRRFR